MPIAIGSSTKLAITKRSAAAANVGYAPSPMHTRIANQVVPQISAQATYAATTAFDTECRSVASCAIRVNAGKKIQNS
jgi:hypothetical protein